MSAIVDKDTSIANIDNNNDDQRISQLFLLVENPKKSNNLGPIIRCATAFGISTIIVIGYSQCSTNGMLFERMLLIMILKWKGKFERSNLFQRRSIFYFQI
jgi:hypothetical protein